jgi:signal transduction histidine kinase
MLEVAVAERTQKLRETNIELIQQKNKLESIVAARNKFFSIVSHDLRGPVGNIFQISEMLLSPDLRTEEAFKMLNSAAKQTSDLLENLLTWAKTQKGEIECKLESLNVLAEVFECVDLVKNQADKKGISLVVKIDSQVTVVADRNMFKTVVRNLLSNAIKFTYSGGSIQLLGKFVNDNKSQISVIDEGVGIDKEKATLDIFYPQKGKTHLGTAGETGSGLGLVLCKEFIDRNKGKIWVESAKGKGSNFSFILPSE